MRLNIVVPFLLSLAALLHACKEDGGPPPPTTKDPRTYSWTVDTISYPGSFQTNMRGIWASSPTDVYIVGHNDRAFGIMFHFDGTDWTNVQLNQSEGGTIYPPIGELSKVFGFSSNNIYAVGSRYGDPPRTRDSSVIIHF